MRSSNRVFLVSAAAGFAGMLMIAAGACQAGSPFSSDVPSSWPLRFSGSPLGSTWIGILLAYAGIVVLLGAWYCVGVSAAGRPLRHLWLVMTAWAAPLLVAPPLFSRDAYAYAALGQLARRGLSPYRDSPASLHGPSFLRFVDPLWRHAHAPYGPLFMDAGKANAAVAGHSIFVAVEGYRLLAVLGVLLVAVSVPTIARSVGREPAPAFALAALNPLVLLYLIGGAHNDALMLGLLVAGVALAARGHTGVGIALCALAAEVKIPGLIGAVFIGWAWAGSGAAPRRRAKFVVLSGLIAGSVMVVVSEASGLGWGWLANLSDPGAVISWLDPATAAGLATSHALHAVGITGQLHPVVQAWRVIGLVLAGVITVVMLVRSDRYGLPKALALSLLAIVFLGPIVWPWYETWGVVFLAFVTERWARRLLILLTAVGCFATIPQHADLTATHVVAVAFIVAVVTAVVVLAVLGARRSLAAAIEPSEPAPSLSPG